MKRIVVICFLFIVAGMFAQQQGSVRGTILDYEMNNQPLLFANVQLKGTAFTEQSNLFGNFEINDIEPGEYFLKISFAGYDTKEVSIQVRTNKVTEVQETLMAIAFDFDEVIIEENTTSIAKLSLHQTDNGGKE